MPSPLYQDTLLSWTRRVSWLLFWGRSSCCVKRLGIVQRRTLCMMRWLLCFLCLFWPHRVGGVFWEWRWRRIATLGPECCRRANQRSKRVSWECRSGSVRMNVVFIFLGGWISSFLASCIALKTVLINARFRRGRCFRCFTVLISLEHHPRRWLSALILVWPSSDKLFSWLLWKSLDKFATMMVPLRMKAIRKLLHPSNSVPNTLQCKSGRNQ